ncbi:acetylxylan esterase [Pseudonocardia sp. TRM90224]|uniref:acetylxylan esterase n=1 Tax=Pseudonocardia sp. TRM90224 TaxID=2812678 RepID=UPI001E31E7AB|nr:acetylxylan esterase [Pseudonocardia sp. TRM90224]
MSGFEEYWTAVDAELAAAPARPVLTPVPARSTDAFTAYDVHLSSVGGYRIFGFLSVPRGDGPFPGLLDTPRYGSVNLAPHYRDRLRYVVFAVMHRGQRLADSPFQAAYPGLFTMGIDDPATYVYRAIVADCLRGAEFLLDHPAVDPARVGVRGDDLALVTASRRPRFSAVYVNAPFDAPGELDDLLRAEPAAEPAARATLSLFDPGLHAVDVPVLRAGHGFELTHEDAADDTAADAWLAGKLGVAPIAKFAVT